MTDLLVRDVPESLKESLIARADEAGRSVSDEVKAILQREFPAAETTHAREELSAWEALKGVLSSLTPEERDEFSSIMDEVEAERKKDFGRPFEDHD